MADKDEEISNCTAGLCGSFCRVYPRFLYIVSRKAFSCFFVGGVLFFSPYELCRDA